MVRKIYCSLGAQSCEGSFQVISSPHVIRIEESDKVSSRRDMIESSLLGEPRAAIRPFNKFDVSAGRFSACSSLAASNGELSSTTIIKISIRP
jgi:hypothetical protein